MNWRRDSNSRPAAAERHRAGRWRRRGAVPVWRKASGAALALLLLLPAPAWGEPAVVQPGDVAPGSGLYLPDEDVRKLSEVLRDGDAARAVAETQRAALEARDKQILELLEQIKALQVASRAQEIALAKAEERDRIRAEIDAKQEAMVKQLVEVLTEERRQRQRERWLSLIPIIGTALLLFGFGGLGR